MIRRHVGRNTAGARAERSGGEGTAAPLVPAQPTLKRLREAARTCRACPLWARATQTVFGLGQAEAKVMMVGEQPGFEEDRIGTPFIGPAGRLLDKALDQAGIAREEVYVTNVVKHFKWESKGQQHLHKKPNASEIAACRPWLEAELQVVKPRVLVCLGATAAQALLGRDFRVSRQRGAWLDSPLAPQVLATVHPSSILRAPNDDARHEQMAQFVADLKKVAAAIRRL
jgi:uracil-DNA glycosylase